MSGFPIAGLALDRLPTSKTRRIRSVYHRPFVVKDGAAPTFTPLRSDGIEALLGLMREFYAIERLTFDQAGTRRSVEQLLRDPQFGRILLIESGRELAGYLVVTFGFSLEFHGRFGVVDEVYVREPFRGRGAGTAALAVAERVCAGEGVGTLRLEVHRSNAAARALYRRAGFRAHDRDLMTKCLDRR